MRFKDPKEYESYQNLKKKVFKTIKEFKLINKNDRILVALSGGKDSMLLTLILKDYFEEKLNKELKDNFLALHVDVGISQNKIQTERAKKLAEAFGIPFKIVKAPIEIDKAYLKTKNVCRICGIQRRHIYVKEAIEHGLNTIATGHNLDDEVETFLMNILQNNWQAAIDNYIIKESAHFPKKIKPFYFVSNEETKRVAIELNLIEEKKNDKLCLCDCPYSPKSFRYLVREFLEKAKKRDPSILLKTINFQIKFYNEMNKKQEKKEKEIKKCKICGMPSYKEICKFCELINKFNQT